MFSTDQVDIVSGNMLMGQVGVNLILLSMSVRHSGHWDINSEQPTQQQT